MERFLSQIINMVMRTVLNKGVNAGINHLAQRGKSAQEMTPEEREQARKAKGLAQKARKMARLGRRL